MTEEVVNHPAHYNKHPSGVECITIIRYFPGNVANAVKYLWRAGLKTFERLTDIEKALWYVLDEHEMELAKYDTRPVVERCKFILYDVGVCLRPKGHEGLHCSRIVVSAPREEIEDLEPL